MSKPERNIEAHTGEGVSKKCSEKHPGGPCTCVESWGHPKYFLQDSLQYECKAWEKSGRNVTDRSRQACRARQACKPGQHLPMPYAMRMMWPGQKFAQNVLETAHTTRSGTASFH
eukprot:356939-Chlamydomonas_euryale.AAC.10